MHMPDEHDITVHLPGGAEIEPEVPGHDTDGDGVADSVVLLGDDGEVTIVSDADGDGSADLAVEITARGEITVAEHTGDGEWAVLKRAHLGDGPAPRADDRDGWAPAVESHVDSPVTVDPATGEWIK
ncbi:MAG: hypothetical protein M3R63_10490 [Actinomycetota bacterium]|nr:hypothetical protein [Actinomycetota bacterium]